MIDPTVSNACASCRHSEVDAYPATNGRLYPVYVCSISGGGLEEFCLMFRTTPQACDNFNLYAGHEALR